MLYEKDFILRLVRQMALFLGKLLRLREERRCEEALDELRRASSDLLGLAWDVLGAVDAATAASLLGDPRKLEVLARLLAEEAEIRALQNDASAARASAHQALEVWREAGQPRPLDEGTPAAMERMRALLAGR